jgi:SAM-dependent methyltransferase
METQTNFGLYSRYYDAFYREKKYRDEAEYVRDRVQRYAPGSTTVLELGCGSGAHAEYLVNQGFEVTGIDRSEGMVAVANSKNLLGFTAVVGDITSFVLPGRFDVAISLFHVVSYLTDNDSLVHCFDNVRRHLNEEGLFLFEVWYTPAVYHLQPAVREKTVLDGGLKITRLSTPLNRVSENVVEVDFDIVVRNGIESENESFHESHHMRHFGIKEIDLLARLTGFELLTAEEFLTGQEPGNETWSVCFLLKKKRM